MNLRALVRKNIFNLEPYSCARDEFQGEASVYLDANESPYNSPYNRYPDPLQRSLKEKIAKIKGVRAEQILIGNGSDESIDLTFRVFCEPSVDNVVAMEPTYGMYKVCADINNVEYRKVALEDGFKLRSTKVLDAVDEYTKVIFLCSPNNPTGNLMDKAEILKILTDFGGIIAIDEAYIDFAGCSGWLPKLDKYPNLVIYQTFSKAWGLSSMRCGLAFAREEIIVLFNKVKYPYNISSLTQNAVSEQLSKGDEQKNCWVEQILAERRPLIDMLRQMKIVKEIYHSDANFILIKVVDANKIYEYLTQKGIIVRNRSRVSLCDDCLRITVGTPDENHALVEALKTYL
ncbi:MAG: histidinol-phosphate transaminase [Dysgonamonadaceae bacterium]|nr:histidinol-phosphate transaminase [Dysgonamonadaceae bacterium]